jgi:hypothetical protein
MRSSSKRIVDGSVASTSEFATTRTSRRTPAGLVVSPMPSSPSLRSSRSKSSTEEIPAAVVANWVGRHLAQRSRWEGLRRTRRRKTNPGAQTARASGKRPRSASARAPGPRLWIQRASPSVRQFIEAEAVRNARILLEQPRATFTRTQIRDAIDATQARGLKLGMDRTALWMPAADRKRVPRGVRPIGSMERERLSPDLLRFMDSQGIPFAPEANPRRRRRRRGDMFRRRTQGRHLPAYVFRFDGLSIASVGNIVSSMYLASQKGLVRRSRRWELIVPDAPAVRRNRGRSDALAGFAATVADHIRRHGGAVALVNLPTPRGDDFHAVALTVLPATRHVDSKAFLVSAYDPAGSVTYDRAALMGLMESYVAPALATKLGGAVRMRVSHCDKLGHLGVQYKREGACVPAALALMLRLCAMLGNRKGGCAKPYQQLTKEDVILAAQLVTWYNLGET